MRLHDHSFLCSTVGGPASAIIAKSGPRGPAASDPKELYVIAVLVAAGELATLIDQLTIAVQSLAGYRRPKVARRGYPNRADHIAYHLENHLIRSVSIYDRALLLTNVVFKLGLPERTCSPETVAKNEHVRATPVSRALRSLELVVKPLREQRNLIVHRRAYSDGRLHDVEGYYILESDDLRKGKVSSLVRRFTPLYKSLTDAYVREKKGELQLLNEKLEGCAVKVLDALEPEFKKRCEVAC
jgi:hypothetical protein